MNRHTLPLAVALLAGSAVAVAAQQPTRPMENRSGMGCEMAMGGMMGMMGGGFMGPGRGMRGEMRGGRMDDQTGGAMGGSADDSSMMSRVQARLGLTDAQMQQMRTMHESACAAAQPHLTQAMQERQAAMRELMKDKPDFDDFEDHLDKANKQMVDAQVGMAKAMIQFRNSLTPAQRQTIDQMEQEMMQRRNRADSARGGSSNQTPPRER